MATADITPSDVGEYPKEIVLGEVDPRYLCGKCRLILKQPSQSYCGHCFCKKCAALLISQDPSGHVPCPQCVEEGAYEEDQESCTISKDKVLPDRALTRDLRNMKVRCINPSCDWSGTFEQYDDHLTKCSWQLARCGCGKELSADQFNEHELRDCVLRMVPCRFCNRGIIAMEMEAHLNSCPSKPPGGRDDGSWELIPSTLCPFGCAKALTSLDELLHHYAESNVEHTTRLLRITKQLESQLASSTPHPSSLPSREDPTPPHSIEPARPPQAPIASAASSGISAGSASLQDELKVLEDTVAVVVNEVNRDEEAIKKLERHR